MTSEQVFWIFGIGFVFGLLAGALGAWLLSLFRNKKQEDEASKWMRAFYDLAQAVQFEKSKEPRP